MRETTKFLNHSYFIIKKPFPICWKAFDVFHKVDAIIVFKLLSVSFLAEILGIELGE